ncbi:MAG: DAK2 domain-containing protein [Clostridiales bacterium]|jgi:DAK2 domain fusion protein YloV|nr:DAK2 domain-containing protein [Clostridiales bacterium]
MGTISVDGNLLKKMIIAGSNALNQRRAEIDAMNVFPVPDGDTGINMSMTVLAAAREASKLNTPNIYDVAKAASSGSLRGARGNSGVILSQLFRGFAKGLEEIDVATAYDLANAAQKAMETAYKAVMKPKEGTILTIAKALSEQAAKSAEISDDIETFVQRCVKHANNVLERTPQMLMELKQAGVVDAGGKGLLVVLEGALRGMNRPMENLLEIGQGDQKSGDSTSFAPAASNGSLAAAAAASGDIKFGYCTEFFILSNKITQKTEDSLKEYLETVGDSIVVVADEDIIKIHVHTNHPGRVLERALTVGALSNLKIENMREQHTTLINFSDQNETIAEQPPKDVGFVTIAVGEGLKELFINSGADEVIMGGQTMNPSTDDILNSINKVNAKTVFVLPNNKNIVLAAQQAAKLCNDKEVIVIPTKSIPQGLSCIISYSDTFSLDENTETMKEAMEQTHSGQITFAVRDTITPNGVEISKDDYICMLDGDIVLSGKDLQQAAKDLIAAMANNTENGPDIISVYYGADATEDMAGELARYAADNYGCDVEVLYGGQPLYFYIISQE